MTAVTAVTAVTSREQSFNYSTYSPDPMKTMRKPKQTRTSFEGRCVTVKLDLPWRVYEHVATEAIRLDTTRADIVAQLVLADLTRRTS